MRRNPDLFPKQTVQRRPSNPESGRKFGDVQLAVEIAAEQHLCGSERPGGIVGTLLSDRGCEQSKQGVAFTKQLWNASPLFRIDIRAYAANPCDQLFRLRKIEQADSA
ncbi:hypothetical protein SDC9_177457 [bioreactor metagenome]|uniref:Uncharacterized protein n=1 Tax=bioreactor metagenome TaxID=1076179 RepID=A0A645GUI6_9ZZZZ